MDTGRDFLRAQLNNSLAQHGNLIISLRDHAEQAESSRYRQLCTQYLPAMERHQGMLEQYGRQIGAETVGGSIKDAIGSVFAKARDAVDAMRESDFLRVVGDIVLIRQAQDTFRTFAVAGEQLGDTQLAQIGREAEAHHDDMQRDFNDLAAEIFVQRASATSDADAGHRTTATTHDM